MMDLSMQIANGSNVQSVGIVVALNVVDLDDYVKKSELEAMNPMTWGNTTEE